MGLKQTLAEQEALVGERPEVFEVQFTAGGFGWVVVYLDHIEREELAELTFEAWRLLRAPGRPRGTAPGLSGSSRRPRTRGRGRERSSARSLRSVAASVSNHVPRSPLSRGILTSRYIG